MQIIIIIIIIIIKEEEEDEEINENFKMKKLMQMSRLEDPLMVLQTSIV